MVGEFGDEISFRGTRPCRSLSRAGGAGVGQGAQEVPGRVPGRVPQAEGSHRLYRLKKNEGNQQLAEYKHDQSSGKGGKGTQENWIHGPASLAAGLPWPSCPFHGELVCWRRRREQVVCQGRPSRKLESGVLATRRGNG